MRHIISTLRPSEMPCRLVCGGPNCSPTSWLAERKGGRVYHLLRMKNNFYLTHASSRVCTPHLNELYRGVRRWLRRRRLWRWLRRRLPLEELVLQTIEDFVCARPASFRRP